MRIVLLLLCSILSLPAQALFESLLLLNPPVPESTTLIQQGFEGTGYENSSTESWYGGTGNGTENPDFTTPFADGSQCLSVTNGNKVIGSWIRVSTNKDHIFGYCQFLVQNTNVANTFIYAETNHSSGAFVSITTAAKVQISNHTGAKTATTVAAIATNLITHLWWEWDNSTGAGNVEFSTDGTRPTSGNNYASYTAGATTGAFANMTGILFTSGNASHSNLFDRVRVSLIQIGDSP